VCVCVCVCVCAYVFERVHEVHSVFALSYCGSPVSRLLLLWVVNAITGVYLYSGLPLTNEAWVSLDLADT